VADIEAAYGTCDVFTVDLDQDREPEVVIESGTSRGTSAYVRNLEIYRYDGTGYDRVFLAPLNGYVSTPDGPDGWERSYSFVPGEGALVAIVLRNRLWPATSRQADAQDLDVLQFPVREYCWRTPPGAYRLCRYEYSESGAPPNKPAPRTRPARER
jgi:hypothetical protein